MTAAAGALQDQLSVPVFAQSEPKACRERLRKSARVIAPECPRHAKRRQARPVEAEIDVGDAIEARVGARTCPPLTTSCSSGARRRA